MSRLHTDDGLIDPTSEVPDEVYIEAQIEEAKRILALRDYIAKGGKDDRTHNSRDARGVASSQAKVSPKNNEGEN